MTELGKLKQLKVGDKVKVKSGTGARWCQTHAGEVLTITRMRIRCSEHANCNSKQCVGYDIELEGENSTRCLSTRWFKTVTIRKLKKKEETRLETLII